MDGSVYERSGVELTSLKKIHPFGLLLIIASILFPVPINGVHWIFATFLQVHTKGIG